MQRGGLICSHNMVLSCSLAVLTTQPLQVMQLLPKNSAYARQRLSIIDKALALLDSERCCPACVLSAQPSYLSFSGLSLC